MPKRDATPRRSPRQTRSHATVATILEAAARVLATESLPGLNTNRVAEVAGVSVGSLYQYFPNKAALTVALIEQAQHDLATALEHAIDASDGQTLENACRALVRVAIDQQYGRPLLAAALDREELRLPVQQAVGAAEKRILACVETLLHRHRAALTVGPTRAAARDCFVIAKAMVEADGTDKPPADLEARIVRALTGYLTCELGG